eukprot:202350_1
MLVFVRRFRVLYTSATLLSNVMNLVNTVPHRKSFCVTNCLLTNQVVTMQQVLTLVFLVESFSNYICAAQSYDDADCSGSICAQLDAGEIECIDPTQGSLPTLSAQSYNE